MDHQSTPTLNDLKYMLFDENIEPKALPLSLLEEITRGFSKKQEIGRGGFAVVYQGVLDNGAFIAVKKLYNTYMYEKEFHREVECLIKVKHKNVVRFIGYCVDTQGKAERYNGKFVMADVQQRLLCFEYLPHETLDKYITDASRGLDWRMRYKIINGICDGLHYLHKNNIIHMDLKPQNILLDGNMIPKIADFGLSRCFDEKQSRAITSKIGGTVGYLAPEFGSHEVTYQFNLYGLGVIIIEILTGKKGYADVENAEPDSDDPHQGATEAPGGTSSETSSISGLLDEMSSTAVSTASSDQLRQDSVPKGLGEMNTEDSSFSGSSIVVSGRIMSGWSCWICRVDDCPWRRGAWRKMWAGMGKIATMPDTVKLADKGPNQRRTWEIANT